MNKTGMYMAGGFSASLASTHVDARMYPSWNNQNSFQTCSLGNQIGPVESPCFPELLSKLNKITYG